MYTDDFSSRLGKMTYPGNFAINYTYSNGYLNEIRNADGNSLIWQLQETTPLNQVEKYTNGNNLITTRTYDYKTGMVNRIQTGTIQDLMYSFNSTTGNLTWRRDNMRSMQENFGYNGLNRLNSITFNGNTLDILYDNNGNIESKEDIGTYDYTGPQPHAVTSVVPSGSYSPETQEAGYTTFDKLSTLSQGTKNLSITYGYDHERRKTVYTNGSATKTKIFVPGGYEKITEGSTTREFYYISTPAGVTSIYEKVNGTGSIYYVHTDYLGSVHFITNGSGGTVQELSFDAWGRQRKVANWNYTSLPVLKFKRGHTFHEHLPELDLINMSTAVIYIFSLLSD